MIRCGAQHRKKGHWLSDSLVPLNSLKHQSWIDYNRAKDHHFKKATDDKIYGELERQVNAEKGAIKDAIAEERKALGGEFRHFHYELDMWDEGYTKRNYIALYITFVDVRFCIQTKCLAFRLWEGPAENAKIAEWKLGILKEYGLKDSETRTNTSDA
eukprot:gene8341-5829_t